VDPGRDELVAAFGAAGLLVCDVSSVLVDWYATGRPVLVTDVAGLGENEVWRRYPTTRGAGVVDASSADLESLVAEAFGSDRMQQERVRAAASMLGEVGRAQERFDAALTAVIRPR
jgi:CDP-glycerol glycerophosphotransferase (TagB/SpsB family)